MSIGEHQLSILFKNKLQRQLTIDVIRDETTCLSNLKPFGPGLKRAIVGLPTEFYVDLNQQTITNATTNHDHIQFSLEPSYQAEIDYEQQMATVRYIPLKEGDCPIHILEYNKDTLHSPFIAQIKQETLLPDKPRIQVIGLTEEIIIHRPVEFRVRSNILFCFEIKQKQAKFSFLLQRFLLIILLMIQLIHFILKC
jgi:hypothetical protein